MTIKTCPRCGEGHIGPRAVCGTCHRELKDAHRAAAAQRSKEEN